MTVSTPTVDTVIYLTMGLLSLLAAFVLLRSRSVG
jgi:hypothetical protein